MKKRPTIKLAMIGKDSTKKEINFEYLAGPPNWETLVNADMPVECKIMVLAALTTYTLGNKGIDRILKQYGESWRAQMERGDAYEQ